MANAQIKPTLAEEAELCAAMSGSSPQYNLGQRAHQAKLVRFLKEYLYLLEKADVLTEEIAVKDKELKETREKMLHCRVEMDGFLSHKRPMVGVVIDGVLYEVYRPDECVLSTASVRRVPLVMDEKHE